MFRQQKDLIVPDLTNKLKIEMETGQMWTKGYKNENIQLLGRLQFDILFIWQGRADRTLHPVSALICLINQMT